MLTIMSSNPDSNMKSSKVYLN
uniref:Uncharacterized protein n=1 Tax=Rhizophora mucronata TaxID=61149 RepID=A0A2P2R4V8_RHIMU